MSETTETTASAPEADLLVRMVQANYNAYAANTRTLITSLQEQVADLTATLAAVRENVMLAFDGPYMPTPARIRGLLWPAAQVVDLYRESEGR